METIFKRSAIHLHPSEVDGWNVLDGRPKLIQTNLHVNEPEVEVKFGSSRKKFEFGLGLTGIMLFLFNQHFWVMNNVGFKYGLKPLFSLPAMPLYWRLTGYVMQQIRTGKL